jgi:hypothetical protein
MRYSKPSEINRRGFLWLAGAGALGLPAMACRSRQSERAQETSGPRPVVQVQANGSQAAIPVLSWDTEGGDRARTNLLRAQSPVALRARIENQWHSSTDLQVPAESGGAGRTRYRVPFAPEVEVTWGIESTSDSVTMTVAGHGNKVHKLEAVELFLPFDPQVTPTTLIPQSWTEDGHGRLPAVISSPDFGQMRMEDRGHPGLAARLEGSRKGHTVDLILELPALGKGESYTLNLTPVILPAPAGLADAALWKAVRRGWFNTWQPSSRWGEQDRPFSAPAGILANNVISDPVSFALPFYADQALWTPEIAPGISIMAQVRRSIDWWLDHRMDPTGEVIGYWDYRHFLDSNPGILISAWDYVEATGDREWLSNRIDRLEFLSSFVERRDVDNDGMVEATQSGNYGTLKQPARSCCWWDALNCGHQDGYTNALIYRAWRCLADLEGQLGRAQQQAHYTQLADRLKAAYAKTLYHPRTGWLAWWKSADGQLHDYATPIVNGLAIDYGLVEPDEGRKILARLWQKMQEVGFRRLDLGLPCTLVPVRKGDYLQPEAIGMPSREDGTDTFQIYMNGGISAGHTLHFIMAHHAVGEPQKGEQLLQAMLGRQTKVGFHNGVRDKGGEGMDWTTWDGRPGGYEGYLSDVFRFMQAVALREPSLRARFYRPMRAQS